MTSRLAALALAVVALVVAGLVAVRSTGNGTTRPSTRTPATTADATPPVVREVEAFVEQVRDRQFKTPVPVRLLTGSAFTDRLFDESEEDKQQVQLAQRSLRAVRLIGADVDLEATYKRFVGGAVVGFYDPKRHELVVRGTTFSPYARTVLAHELTHALDDQWFGIERPELDKPGNDEAAAAFQALTEGNAVRVQERFAAQLSAAARRAAGEEEAKAGASMNTKGVPEVIPEIVTWPYQVGPAFIRALLKAGGEKAVDDGLANPPTTTEQIANPSSYLQHLPIAAVPTPAADGPVLDKGVYGWESLLFTLEPVVGTDEATRAANGWAGDSYVLWDAGGGRSCVRATFTMRTPSDLGQLISSLQAWAGDRQAKVESTPSSVTFTSCG